MVRYIGQTVQPLKRRLIQHLAVAKHDGTVLYRWIRKTLRNGHDIQIQLLEADCEWDVAERRWIAQHDKDVLVNLSEGGCGYSGPRSDEVKARMRGPKSDAHKAAMRKPKSAAHRANMSASLAGNIRSRGEANRTAVLSEGDVIMIKRRLTKGWGVSDLAREYGVQKAAISKIKTGRNWAYIQP